VVISISKRVGSAPKRNRLKRLIREALRQSRYLGNASWDCGIFITQPLQRKPTLLEVEKYINHFFSHLSDEADKQTE